MVHVLSKRHLHSLPGAEAPFLCGDQLLHHLDDSAPLL